MSGDTSTETKQPLFRDIAADDDDPEITEMESLCVNCEAQGVTRLFLTKIPFFREVIVSSFSCEECGMRNSELQPAGRIQDNGCVYSVSIKTPQDLNRQVVQSQYAAIRIPVLDFEAPPKKGVLTTVEGILTQTIEDLSQGQVLRKIQAPEVAAKIDEFIEKTQGLLQLKTPFQIIVDDPSGNSFVENPRAPSRDPEMTISHYRRTHQQNIDIGIAADDSVPEEAEASQEMLGTKSQDFDSTNEVMSFPTNCPGCNAPCETNMKLVNIPYFKEVVIMATFCDICGHRDNEVKSGGGMEDKGRKITLTVENRDDMSRDILKSETCCVLIPELEFETDMGTLGGKFTTVEGLLLDFKGQLRDSNPFLVGDSSQSKASDKLSVLCDKIDKIIKGEMTNVHFILDDPAGNSYIQSFTAPDPDRQLTVEDYERSFQQNEDLGLNDMQTENYQQS